MPKLTQDSEPQPSGLRPHTEPSPVSPRAVGRPLIQVQWVTLPPGHLEGQPQVKQSIVGL